MKEHDIISEVERTSPEDAKLTLCFMIGYLSEKPEVWDDVSRAYQYSPTRPDKILSVANEADEVQEMASAELKQ